MIFWNWPVSAKHWITWGQLHHQSAKFAAVPLCTTDETSNVTSITEVWSASARLFAGRWHRLASDITTPYYVSIICRRPVWYRTFSALCVYSKCGHHPHTLGYLCAKFCFFRDLLCWASPWWKIAYSITLIQLIWCLGNRSTCALA